jgi:hypothetical protein
LLRKATKEKINDIQIVDNPQYQNYQTAKNQNLDVNNTFDKLMNSNLNISEIEHDNIIIKETDSKPLYNLV